MKRLRWFTHGFACLLLAAFVAQAHASSLPDFTALVEQQGPAVVNISTTQSRSTRLPGIPGLPSIPGIDENDPMFELFRRFIPGMPDIPRLGPDGRSLGSGFIVSEDGYILTNAHVVEDADEILVRLADKREYHAQIVGSDARSDVAVIKIDAQALPTVVIGDPDALKVGEWVVAIGSPFGFEQTVTAGIVSAKGRTLPAENFVPFIQTDVAINPGNSGGPLFNLRGEVVGINSQIYSQTGGFMGLSFAIPIDVAMNIQTQLRTTGQVQRGRIGVAIQEVTRALADSFGLQRAEGALVSGVEPDGPAFTSGIQTGDVIVAFDGKPVASSSDLPRIVAAGQPGAVVMMDIVRNGEPMQVQITLGEWRDAPTTAESARAQPAEPELNKLGLAVVKPEPDPTKRETAGQPSGLVIERAHGAAARADLRRGDRILAIVVDGRQTLLDSVDTFNSIVAGLSDGQTATLLVQRGEGTSYVSLRAGE